MLTITANLGVNICVPLFGHSVSCELSCTRKLHYFAIQLSLLCYSAGQTDWLVFVYPYMYMYTIYMYLTIHVHTPLN